MNPKQTTFKSSNRVKNTQTNSRYVSVKGSKGIQYDTKAKKYIRNPIVFRAKIS